MKKCDICGTDMIEETELHTDYVGGVDFEERIYLSYKDNSGKYQTKRVKARVCPNCGKMEIFIKPQENYD